MIVPREGLLLPSSLAKGLSGEGAGGGGGRYYEIDTCISHRHVKSDIVRSTSVDQGIHVSLKLCRIF